MRNGGELGERADLERVVGGAEGVEGAPHLRHPVPPRLLRPVVVLVAVAMPPQRQRHQILSPPPHRRRHPRLSLSLSYDLSLIRAIKSMAEEGGGSLQLLLEERGAIVIRDV